MPSIFTTEQFDAWFDNLRDRRTRVRIQVRIDRLELGNPGDSKQVSAGVHELRIDHGPGYRVYYGVRGDVAILLLCGGDKSTQRADISTAQELFRVLNWE